MTDPNYVAWVDKDVPEGSADPIWGKTIVGNLLQEVEEGEPIFRAMPDYAYQFRDALLAQPQHTK